MERIKAVLFDMDGVLIEAKDWHYEALNRALKLLGLEISYVEHLTTFDGLPTKKKLEILSIERNLPRGLHDFINQMKQQYTMEIVYQACKPRFFHQFALSRLHKEGYKMAVCSNSIFKTIDVMMQKAALKPYLEFYISNEDVTHGKPNPEMYLKAMERLQLPCRECLIIEDNDNGIKAALASGANVMVVRDVSEVNYENIKQHIAKFEEEFDD